LTVIVINSVISRQKSLHDLEGNQPSSLLSHDFDLLSSGLFGRRDMESTNLSRFILSHNAIQTPYQALTELCITLVRGALHIEILIPISHRLAFL
jgi:hypothetical protein